MISTSHVSKRSEQASASSAAVPTLMYLIPGARGIDTFAAMTVTLAPRRFASSASANPIRPHERLPTKRTDRSVRAFRPR